MAGTNLKFQLQSCGATGLACACLLAAALGATAIAQSASSADLSQRYAQQGSEALAAGKLAEAEQAFVKLRALQPGVAEVHANLGAVYFQEGKLEEAAPSLRQALKAMACNFLQGFFFSRPVVAEHVPHLLRQRWMLDAPMIVDP